MNKYEKLITALRCSGDGIDEEADGLGCANKKCKYRDADGACDLISMTLDAAAAITALQSENAELREENGCLQHNVTAMQATLDQQAKNCEELLAEKDKHLSRVEAERDAAITDVPHDCEHCKHAMALIEREAAEKEALIKKVESMTPNQFYRFIMAVCGAYLRQDAAPVVHGRWITRYDGPYKQARKYCSACGKHSGLIKERPYCPNCGARMDGGEDDG